MKKTTIALALATILLIGAGGPAWRYSMEIGGGITDADGGTFFDHQGNVTGTGALDMGTYPDLNTEAKLEAILGDVSDIYTNLDGPMGGASDLFGLDDLTLFGTEASGDLLVYDGTDWRNRVLSGDATLSSLGALSLSADSVGAGEIEAGAVGTSEVNDGTLAVADMAFDPIEETELDTEAELVTQLTDVTNIFTNNDGALTDDDVTDDDLFDLSNVTLSGSFAAGDVLLYGGATWKNEALSGDATLSSAGVLSLGAGVVGTTEIATDGVAAAEIAAGAVGTSEVADNTLTADDLAANSVNASEITDGQVGAAEIATDAVQAAEIQANAVGSSEMADNAIGTAEVTDGTLTTSDVAFDPIEETEMDSLAELETQIGTSMATQAELDAAVVVPSLVLMASAAMATTTGGAAVSSIDEQPTNDVDYFFVEFNDADTQTVFWNFVVPDGWTDTTPSVTITWYSPDTATTNVVQWQIRTLGRADGEAMDAAPGGWSAHNDTNTGQDKTNIITVASGLAAIWTAGDQVTVWVRRNGTDAADTLADEARLLSVVIKES